MPWHLIAQVRRAWVALAVHCHCHCVFMQMRMELLAQLWAVGISAELVPKETPSLTEQYEFAHGSGARWLVILDDKTLGPNETVRVKGLERKGEDCSIHMSDLGGPAVRA